MKECKIRSFGILGTADFNFKKVSINLPKDQLVIDGADHGMEIPGNPMASIEVLHKVIQATSDWIL